MSRVELRERIWNLLLRPNIYTVPSDDALALALQFRKVRGSEAFHLRHCAGPRSPTPQAPSGSANLPTGLLQAARKHGIELPLDARHHWRDAREVIDLGFDHTLLRLILGGVVDRALWSYDEIMADLEETSHLTEELTVDVPGLHLGRSLPRLAAFLSQTRRAIPVAAAKPPAARNVDIGPRKSHKRPATTLAMSRAIPVRRLKSPKAEPRTLAGALSATIRARIP